MEIRPLPGLELFSKGLTKIKKISALGRPLVFDCLTNRLIAFVVLLTLILVLVFRLLAGDNPLQSLTYAAATAAVPFFNWSIAREIDPAHDWSAFAGVPFSLFAALFFGPPGLAALFFILLVARVLNRITGLGATILDSFLLLLLAAILFRDGFNSAPFFLAVVFLADAAFEPRNTKQGVFVFAALSLAFLLCFLLPAAPDLGENFGLPSLSAMIIAVAAVAVLYAFSGRKQVRDDLNRSMLNRSRICLALILPASFIVLELVLQGNRAFYLLYPALFACGGAALYHLARLLARRYRV